MFSLRKNFTRYVAVLLVLVVLFSFVGCSGNNSLVGEYTGTAGSFLKLNKDGTCIYAYNGTGTGKWFVEDDVLYVHVSNLRLPIYAHISDSDDGLLFESEWSSWNAEYFTKND